MPSITGKRSWNGPPSLIHVQNLHIILFVILPFAENFANMLGYHRTLTLEQVTHPPVSATRFRFRDGYPTEWSRSADTRQSGFQSLLPSYKPLIVSIYPIFAISASETARFFCTQISSAAGAADELCTTKRKEPNMGKRENEGKKEKKQKKERKEKRKQDRGLYLNPLSPRARV